MVYKRRVVILSETTMTQQWIAAASKCVRRSVQQNVRKNAIAQINKRTSSTLFAPSSFRAFSVTPHPSETFLTGTNNAYVEEMYTSWKTSPSRYVSISYVHPLLFHCLSILVFTNHGMFTFVN